MSSFSYVEGTILQKENKKRITNSLTFQLEEGKTLALIGQSGSGKTLTALSILGLLPRNLIFLGTIEMDGHPLTPKEQKLSIGKDIVYIPQNGHEFLNPSLKVKTQLKDTKKRTNSKLSTIEALGKAGFSNPEEVLNLYPFELSGGMAQRVTIAMAILSDPTLIIADEATNGLDYSDSISFIEYLNSLFPTSAKLVITHDLKVASLCDDIFVLHHGNKIEYGPKDSVLNSTHPYIESLRNSRVSNGMKVDKVYEEVSL